MSPRKYSRLLRSVGCCQSITVVSLVKSGLMPSGSTVAPTNTTLVMNNLVLLADSNSFLLHTQFSSVKMSVMC